MRTHLSSQFDAELNALADHMMHMGGLVEAQMAQVCVAIGRPYGESFMQTLDLMMRNEQNINKLERDIDLRCASIITCRQPTVSDLRFVLAMLKICNNLERMGDEAYKVARLAVSLIDPKSEMHFLSSELQGACVLAQNLLHEALDALARLSATHAKQVIRDDAALDAAFKNIFTQLSATVPDKSEATAQGLNLVLLAKAIERVGDHAKNIAEAVIYIVDGDDVRHTPAPNFA